MVEFCIGALVGMFIGVFAMAIFQANRNEQDIARANHAIRLADIKAEAIKDFAERLKKDSHIRYDSDTNEVIGAIVCCGEIDDFVKEMTEEK